MNDNLSRYYAIQKALKQQRATEPKGNEARHLNTLALFIAGIIASQKCSLQAIARKVPSHSKPQSRVRKMERWLANKKIDQITYYLPYLMALLQRLPDPLVLVIDGSEIGRGCVLLSLNVVYKKRALPLCWLVVKGKKGHLSEATHIQLVHKLLPLLPKERKVVFLGDGEFDGVNLLCTLQEAGWNYVCRTAKNVLLTEDGECFQPIHLMLKQGDRIELPDVQFTASLYGPVLVCIIWEPTWKEPLILVSNLDFLPETYKLYRRRFCIETFFSDQKSRGFYLCHSHLSDPEHLDRLVIATCLAYIWLVCLGDWVVKTRQLGLIHRTHRCDWSLFQIGLAWVDFCLNEGIPLWTQFSLPEMETQ